MHPQCEFIARYVLPAFRSLVAKDLVEKYGFTQVEAAEKLGTTQAAISQYLHSKRGYGGAGYYNTFLPAIRKAAVEAARCIAKEDASTEKVTEIFCGLCNQLKKASKH